MDRLVISSIRAFMKRLTHSFTWGQRSLEWFRNVNKDCDWCTAALHAVIEHGDYRIYNFIKQDELPVLPSAISTTKFLVIGTMRSKEEIRFAESAFYAARLRSAKLSQAKLSLKQRQARTNHPNIIRHDKRVPDSQVKPLLQASDFVFVTRSGRLNSGVVPLAFTFDTPVIAPNEGVMGEIVEATKTFPSFGAI